MWSLLYLYATYQNILFTLSCAGVLSGVLPPNTEEFDEKKGLKKITEYKYNEEGKIVKVHQVV